MVQLGRRGGWMRWLGFAAVPLVIAASFLGLLIGIAGLCIGADGMGHTDSMTTLCVFFCGVIAPTAVLLAVLLSVLAALPERRHSIPLSPPRSIFHPPTALPA